MPIDIECPKCGSTLRAADEYSGAVARCSTCQTQIQLPSFEPAPPPIVQRVPSRDPRIERAMRNQRPPEDELDVPARKMSSRKKWAIAIGVLLLPLIFTWVSPRNWHLASKLEQCPSKQGIDARAYYVWMSPDSIVLDLGSNHSSGVRRIDVLHLLLQFLSEIEYSGVRRVFLASEGNRIYFVEVSECEDLVESYDGGGRLWALNNCPSRVRNLDGSPAFESWSGGWLGVLKEQSEDIVTLADRWLGG